MKKIVFVVVSLMVLSKTFSIFADESCENLIYEYCESINNNDYTAYSELFTEDIRCDISLASEEEKVFREKNLFVAEVVRLEKDISDIFLSNEEILELSKHTNINAYYAHIEGVFDEGKTGDDKLFYIVKEDDNYRIKYLPNVDLNTLKKYCSEIKTEPENINKVMVTNTMLSCPDHITVRFDKQANRTYYGNRLSITMSFHNYLKNVIPGEWIVSYYGNYPDYLRAGALASKMYAWYYTINPKYNFSPYYADLNDTTETQEYSYNAYSSMAAIYRTYVNNTMSYINGIALLTSNDSVFITEYRSSSGSQGSGILNASQMLQLAQSGYSTSQLLKYYYDYSSAANNQTVKLTACYEDTY